MVGFYLLGCEPQTYVSCIFLIMISSDDYVWDRFEAPGRFCRFGNFPWVCFPSKAISPRKSYALGGPNGGFLYPQSPFASDKGRDIWRLAMFRATMFHILSLSWKMYVVHSCNCISIYVHLYILHMDKA